MMMMMVVVVVMMMIQVYQMQATEFWRFLVFFFLDCRFLSSHQSLPGHLG